MTFESPKNARRRRRAPVGSLEGLSRQPANLPLSAYLAVDPKTTAELVAEFGEASALRILNGKPYLVAVAPADPATIPPPGAKAFPKAHGTATGEARMRQTSG